MLIYDKPSRFDTKENILLSGNHGLWFEENILNPFSLLRENLDIWTVEGETKLIPLPGTKKVILLGDRAAKLARTSTEFHGYPASFFGIPAVVAFTAEDCNDIRSFSSDDDNTSDDDELGANGG